MATSEDAKPYHHGDLRRVLLEAAVASLEESGPAALSLRELARRAGVSHAAPSHHFRDKRGLLTAVATDGFRRLAVTLRAAGHDLGEVGAAYARFAAGQRAYFDVMVRPELYDAENPELVAARSGVRAAVYRAAGRDPDAPGEAGVAAWCLMHGVATLGLMGSLPAPGGGDLEAAARAVMGTQQPSKPKKKKKH